MPPASPTLRDAFLATLRSVYPDARSHPGWAGAEAWAATRPAGAPVDPKATTFDPTLIIAAIVERSSGPVMYLLDPGDYMGLDTHSELLKAAGLKLGRGCLYLPRGKPFPSDTIRELLTRIRARDEGRAPGPKRTTKKTTKGAGKKARKAIKGSKRPARKGARKPTKNIVRKPASRSRAKK